MPVTKTHNNRWLRRLGVGTLLIILGFGGAMGAAGTWARHALIRDFPPPGQLLDVGGFQMHIHCLGSGSPTIILDAGGNDFSIFWAPVQARLAEHNRVCSYDRAGLGWSQSSPAPRTTPVIVQELRQLLAAAQIEGPYLLVGHSLGGVHMRQFARLHPDEVVGLALVDSAHEAQIERIAGFAPAIEQARAQFGTLATLSGIGLLALAPEQIPDRGLPAQQAAQYRAVLAARPQFQGMRAETAQMASSLRAASQAAPATLGELPLLVFSRGLPDPLPQMSAAEAQAYETEWRQLQAELVGLSSRGHQTIASQSGHYIHLDQPQLVVDGLRRLLE